ncbi:sugar ABC transporter ATP-binding protein [candidate division KSB1 bacterium]|nr:sugar ABC transporter ATP-binding protein [candidate division KSB1 bacterium]
MVEPILTPPRFEMRAIHKRFGATIALDNVNFRVHPGMVHALVGENGAGKSTLMKILAGAYKPDSGRMFIDGIPFSPKNPMDARAKGIGMIYQELSLARHLTVAENIFLGREPVRWGCLDQKKMLCLATEALKMLGHGDISPNVKTALLSVSEKQIVEIARSLAAGCRVLVFDEPTSSLGQKDVLRLFELINRLKGQGLAVVYISHFLEEIRQVADNVTVLRDGAVTGTSPVKDISDESIINMMVGKKVSELYPRTTHNTGEIVLSVKGLSGSRLPRDTGLEIRKGEILGIFGLVGAGRTEFARILFGLDPVKSGSIKIGCFSGPYAPKNRWAQGVGYLSENRKEEGLAVQLSIADNITLSRLKNMGPWHIILQERQNKKADKWISVMNITCQHAQQKVSHLSGGNQQKVALARLLHHDVDILLLDEPTKGIDVASKAKIYEILSDLTTQNKSIMLISSYPPELLGICDRIAVMCKGKIVKVKSVREWENHQLMLAATGQRETACKSEN